ncbi:hypothetical protein HMP0015_0353 [Acinetobacter haemolyticus ATCC 19194]|uniref:NADH:ubiquinone oxidoreductase, Na n=2 Tax=Acinetobacter haemolyticus TaxID=29430 RepID=D4XKW1_ACIHA|nr:hypothetical protein HMP0015_0353 [Acinetobacter haemolyticus ATCC 19194]
MLAKGKSMPKFYKLVLLCLCMLWTLSAWAFSSQQLVSDARKQIGVTRFYDPAYTRLDYPMGDVPMVKGVCTDVVVRALRRQGIDLQQRMHEDMRQHFKLYPNKWGLKAPDKNIDHRRVPNIATYFQRKGYQVHDQNYRAGDIVTWDLGQGLVHIGIVSDKNSFFQKTPLILHNIGRGTEESDILFKYKITGHYRIKN